MSLVAERDRSQFLRHLVNGGVATLIHFSVLVFCVEVLDIQSKGLANGIAAVFGIATSFLGNRHFVFRKAQSAIAGQAGRFMIGYALLAVLHAIFIHIWSDRVGLDYRIGFVIATGVQVVASFLFNKRMVFK